MSQAFRDRKTRICMRRRQWNGPPEILFLASRHPIATLKRLFHSRQAIITRYLHSNLCMHDLRLLVSQHGPGRNRVIRFVDSKGTVTWTFNARGRSALSSPIVDSNHISEYLPQPPFSFFATSHRLAEVSRLVSKFLPVPLWTASWQPGVYGQYQPE